MRWAIVCLLAVLGAGCKFRSKTVAAPPAPAPKVVLASSEPLSVPQTIAELPPYQPVPPEAVPPEPDAAPPSATPGATIPEPPPRSTPPPSRQRSQASSNTARVPPVTQSPARPPNAGTGQLRPLLTPEQEQDLSRRIEDLLARAEKILSGFQPQKASGERKVSIERVQAFVEQARQARQQGDLIRAKSLAERAELLASDLARPPQ